jgi:hypothetical protein
MPERDRTAPLASHKAPTYHLSVFVGGRELDFHKPIPDPFHRTDVTIGWRDLLRGLLRRRLVIRVMVGADRHTEEAVLALNPDHLGYADSPSRKAWDARVNEWMGDL